MLRLLLVGLLVTLLSGCTTQTRISGADRPGDFELGVLIVTRSGEGPAGEDARYILDASGILGASYGPGSSLSTSPGFTRRLTTTELGAIWEIWSWIEETETESVRTLSPGAPGPRERFSITGSEQLEDLIIIEAQGGGSQRVVVLDHNNAAALELVDTLSALAWAQH